MEHQDVQEHSLIERYQRGDLSPEEEERFEAHFMDCAACQEELEVERSFARGMKTAAAEDAARSAIRLGLFAWLGRRGVAAVATLAVFALGLAFGRFLREESPGVGGSPTDVPVVLLGVLRSDDGAPALVEDAGGPWSLAVDVGSDPRFASYAVTVVDASGEARFERAGLSPNVLEVIQLTFPSGFLPPGEYRLVARGILPGGETVELGGYDFRVQVR